MLKQTLVVLTLAATLGLSSLAQAEPVGGPKYDDLCINGHSRVEYYEVLYGGTSSIISVGGSGTTLLTLSVYDTYGNLVATSTAYNPAVTVLPFWTQEMTIVVTNRGNFYNCYSILIA